MPLPAAHASFAAPDGWMVSPMPPAIALTKMGEMTQVYLYPAEGSSKEDGQRTVDAMYPGSGGKLSAIQLPGHKGRAAEVTGVERLFGFPTKARGYFVWSPHGDAVLLMAFNPNLDDNGVALARAVAASVRFEPLQRTPPVAIELGSVWQGVTVQGRSPAGFVVEKQNEQEVMLRGSRPLRAMTLRLVPGVTKAHILDRGVERVLQDTGFEIAGKPKSTAKGAWAKVSGVHKGQATSGYVALAEIAAGQSVVAFAVGKHKSEKDLLQMVNGLRVSGASIPPRANATMQRLRGMRLTTIDSGSGWGHETEWNFCSNGRYRYRSSSSLSATYAGASASSARAKNHDGRWLMGTEGDQLVLRILTDQGDEATLPFAFSSREGVAAVVADEAMEYLTRSEMCD